ncbi:MAG TPA: NnrS family protein [Woeseiaceae bacterium]|nr:NnrS family protein [Woeseiaceae bacterium]
MHTPAAGQPDAPRRQLALFAVGLRPFYALAGLFAFLAIPIWVANYVGLLRFDGYLISLFWHQHEMIFGFAVAVIAGFLLTAVRNWTGRATPTGGGLATLALVWLLARILALTGPAWPAAIVDLAFLPLLAVTIAIPIWRSQNRRNIKLLFVLAALTVANLVFHLAYNGVLPMQLTATSVSSALDIILILIAIMGGRVIPAFTANAVPAARPRRFLALEVVAIGSLLLVLAADVLAPAYRLPASVLAALYFVAALAHATRLWLWEPQLTIKNPLLLMLPMAYAWVPVTLLLRGLVPLDLAPSTAAAHALTLGAMTSLMLAMMMRSALGHTGRPLVAGIPELLAFFLMQTAAIVRVLATLINLEHYRFYIILSALIWTLAFAGFLWRYVPMLVYPRIDGKPG